MERSRRSHESSRRERLTRRPSRHHSLLRRADGPGAPRVPGWSCTLSRIYRLGAPAAAFLLSALLAAPASAVPIVGQLGILGTVRFDLAGVHFQAPFPVTGNVVTSQPSDGYFASISGAGTALDLGSALHVNVPLSLPDFLSSFQDPSHSTLSFELTFIQPGAFGSGACGAAPAPGQVCTPAGSAASFTNFSTGSDVSSIVSFIVRGNVTANPDDEGIFTGVYTAQFAGLSYQEVLAAIEGGGSVAASYSASFEAIPEPGAAVLLGACLAALALRRRSASRARR